METQKRKEELNEDVNYLVEMLNSGQYIALAKLRRVDYPFSIEEKRLFIQSLIMPRNLTCDNLKDAIVRWWMDIKTEGDILLQDEADKLTESLKDSVVEIAREAYERGKRGQPF